MVAAVVELESKLDRDTVHDAIQAIRAAMRSGQAPVVLDLGKVDAFDSAGMGVIVRALGEAKAAGIEVRLSGLSESMLEFFSLVSVERLVRPAPAARREDPVTRVGTLVEPLLRAVHGVAVVSIDAFRSLVQRPAGRCRQRVRWDRMALELEAAAFGALPIVCLIGFLLGLILAMQAYVQLQMWGAEIYMANMVSVSVLYEIGPLMTGIILAARSGSSSAAQLGSMVVSEEIDALRQMGVQPIRFLVVPKVLAMAMSALILALVFDVIALIGGALFGYAFAGIDVNVFADACRSALSLQSFLIACVKAVAFGVGTGLVGCGLGLRVEGGSEGVGRATTNAVVFSIFLIILVDAAFVTAQQLWPS